MAAAAHAGVNLAGVERAIVVAVGDAVVVVVELRQYGDPHLVVANAYRSCVRLSSSRGIDLHARRHSPGVVLDRFVRGAIDRRPIRPADPGSVMSRLVCLQAAARAVICLIERMHAYSASKLIREQESSRRPLRERQGKRASGRDAAAAHCGACRYAVCGTYVHACATQSAAHISAQHDVCK